MPRRDCGFWALLRKRGGDAALVAVTFLCPRTNRAVWRFRRAYGGAQIHQCLSKISGAFAGHDGIGSFANQWFRFGQRNFDGMEPREHAFDIAIDRRMGPIKSDGGDGPRRVGADAGKFSKFGQAFRKSPAKLPRHHLCTGMQIAGAGIIAKSGPGFQHIVQRCRGQRINGWPEVQKLEEIGLHGGDGGLLQHDFRQPDVVGVRPSALGSPRQIPAMGVIPGQQAHRQITFASLFRHAAAQKAQF